MRSYSKIVVMKTDRYKNVMEIDTENKGKANI